MQKLNAKIDISRRINQTRTKCSGVKLISNPDLPRPVLNNQPLSRTPSSFRDFLSAVFKVVMTCVRVHARLLLCF